MRRTVIIICLAVAGVPSYGCVAKNIVNRVSPSSATGDMNGVFYALPRTVIETKVPVKKVENKRGKFWEEEFVKCFFPEEHRQGSYVKKDETIFTIGEPRFSSRGEPDPGEIFLIKVPGRYLEDKAISLDLTSGGVMIKGEMSSTDHSVEFTVNAIKTFVPILSNLGVFTASVATQKDPDFFSGDCIKELEKRFGKPRVDEAKLAYKTIINYETSRKSLISGGVNASLPKDTLELMLKEIDDNIKTLRGLFLGTRVENTWIGVFDFTPDHQHMEKVLFEYSTERGVCTINYSGINNLDPDFTSPVSCVDALKVRIKIEKGQRGLPGPQFAEVVKDAKLRQSGERGFYYRIPAVVTVSIETERPPIAGGAAAEVQTITASIGRGGNPAQARQSGYAELGHESIPVAQLGLTVSLPASTNGRTTKYNLSLYEASGAMKSFTLGSDALIQSSQVSDVGTAVSSIVEARNKARATEVAAADELNQLERKRKILEEMVKIKQAEEALKKPSP